MYHTYFKALRSLLRVPTYLLTLVYFSVGFLAAGPAMNWLGWVIGAVIIAVWYVNATSLNDLKDFEIDQVNLSGDADRPLVTGALTKRGLAGIYIGSGVAALGLAVLLGWPAVGLTLVALVFNFAYSMPPLALSRRGGLALAMLPVGYVVFTMLLGSLASGGFSAASLGLLLAINYVQFLARISLKDYRDVKGDAEFGKRTFLLRHGSDAVVRLSLGSHILASTGGAIWLYSFSPLIAAGFVFLAAMGGRFLWQLRLAEVWRQQRIWITAFGRLASGQLILILLALFYKDGLVTSFYQLGTLLVLVAAAFVWSAQQIILRSVEPRAT